MYFNCCVMFFQLYCCLNTVIFVLFTSNFKNKSCLLLQKYTMQFFKQNYLTFLLLKKAKYVKSKVYKTNVENQNEIFNNTFENI